MTVQTIQENCVHKQPLRVLELQDYHTLMNARLKFANLYND
jgi:hypothetical protein